MDCAVAARRLSPLDKPDVSFKEVARVKLLGCHWMLTMKTWMYDLPRDDAQVDPWIRDRLEPPPMTYYRLPYDQRQIAKAAGAKFDFELKVWCDQPPPLELVRYTVVPKAAAAAPQTSGQLAQGATAAAGTPAPA